jgi:hypothetical protein
MIKSSTDGRVIAVHAPVSAFPVITRCSVIPRTSKIFRLHHGGFINPYSRPKDLPPLLALVTCLTSVKCVNSTRFEVTLTGSNLQVQRFP